MNTQPPRWLVYVPEDGWTDFDTLDAAIDHFYYARQDLEETAGDDGWHEDAPALCIVEAVAIRTFALEQYATAEDDTEDGEYCRAREVDFLARGVIEEHPSMLAALRLALRLPADAPFADVLARARRLADLDPARTLDDEGLGGGDGGGR